MGAMKCAHSAPQNQRWDFGSAFVEILSYRLWDNWSM